MGLILSVIDQNFPPQAKWSVDHVPDLTGKVALITGGNSGLGKETARALLRHNAKVYIGCRDEIKAREAIGELQLDTGKEAIFLPLDLADLNSVKSAALDFTRKENSLDILFNNGGVMACPISMITKDGYDMQFGTNVLGHFFLTKLLLRSLTTGAESSSDGKARIINVSSQAHVTTKRINYDTLKDGTPRTKLSPGNLYSQSKFGNVVFSYELARRYGDAGIVSISLHPGSLRTNLGRHLPALTQKFIVSPNNVLYGTSDDSALQHSLCYTPADGARTQIWAGVDPETASANGKYLIPWCRYGEPGPETKDEGEGKKLWEWLEDQILQI